MDSKSTLQLEVEKTLGVEIDEELFEYVKQYATLEEAEKAVA